MQRKITNPLQVTVTDELRKWATDKWQQPYLPDVFLTEFHEHHEASGKKFKNAEQAFRNWISWSAPSGRYYRAEAWEAKLAKAKRYGKRLCRPVDRVAGQSVDRQGNRVKQPVEAVTGKQAAREAIAKIRAGIA